MAGIDNAEVKLIAQVIFECPADNFKRPTFIMTAKVLDVLEQKSSRSVRFQNSGDVEK